MSQVAVLGGDGPGQHYFGIHLGIVVEYLGESPFHHGAVPLVQAVHPGCVPGACLHLTADGLPNWQTALLLKSSPTLDQHFLGLPKAATQLPIMPLMMVLAFVSFRKMLTG